MRSKAPYWLVLWLSAGLLFSASSVWARSPMHGATVAAGTVSVDEHGHWVAGPQGCKLTLKRGVEVVAQPGAELAVGRTTQLSLGAGPSGRVPTQRLTVYSGAVEVSVPVTSPVAGAVLLAGPTNNRAIHRGGLAAVKVNDKGVVWAALDEVLLVGNGGPWSRLQPGQLRAINAWYPRGRPGTVPAQVSGLVSSQPFVVLGPGVSQSAKLSWTPVGSASSYKVLVEDGNGQRVRTQTTSTAEVTIEGLKPGAHRVRVRALHAYGLGGSWSVPIGLQVLELAVDGVRLPPSRQESIRLRPNQRVSLNGAEGIEIAFRGVDQFVPAPSDLGLIAGRPVDAVLRHPGSGALWPLRLEPLRIRADIAIEASPFGWPKQGLLVTVELRDSSGQPVPDSYPVEVRATANLAALKTTWRRIGSTLTARMARPEKSGPWVVRLQVVDGSGAEIGRDVRDIGYQRGPALAAVR